MLEKKKVVARHDFFKWGQVQFDKKFPPNCRIYLTGLYKDWMETTLKHHNDTIGGSYCYYKGKLMCEKGLFPAICTLTGNPVFLFRSCQQTGVEALQAALASAGNLISTKRSPWSLQCWVLIRELLVLLQGLPCVLRHGWHITRGCAQALAFLFHRLMAAS